MWSPILPPFSAVFLSCAAAADDGDVARALPSLPPRCVHRFSDIDILRDVARSLGPSERGIHMQHTLYNTHTVKLTYKVSTFRCLYLHNISSQHFSRQNGASCSKYQWPVIGYKIILISTGQNWVTHTLPVQCSCSGWPTGNGKNLSNTQACCLAQLCLGAA